MDIEKYIPFVRRIAKQFAYVEDAEQIALLELVILGKKCTILSERYLYGIIRHKLIDHWRKEKFHLGVDYAYDEEYYPPQSTFDSVEFADMLTSVVTDELEAKVLTSIVRGYTQIETAARIGTSRSYVQKIRGILLERFHSLYAQLED